MHLSRVEYLIVVLSSYNAKAVEEYAGRQEIETSFGCLKSCGFQLEETHVLESERSKRLMVFLALAFCRAHKVVEWLSQQNALKIKKHGRLAISIFRCG
jgi:hypothetical protein